MPRMLPDSNTQTKVFIKTQNNIYRISKIESVYLIITKSGDNMTPGQAFPVNKSQMNIETIKAEINKQKDSLENCQTAPEKGPTIKGNFQNCTFIISNGKINVNLASQHDNIKKMLMESRDQAEGKGLEPFINRQSEAREWVINFRDILEEMGSRLEEGIKIKDVPFIPKWDTTAVEEAERIIGTETIELKSTDKAVILNTAISVFDRICSMPCLSRIIEGTSEIIRFNGFTERGGEITIKVTGYFNELSKAELFNKVIIDTVKEYYTTFAPMIKELKELNRNNIREALRLLESAGGISGRDADNYGKPKPKKQSPERKRKYKNKEEFIKAIKTVKKPVTGNIKDSVKSSLGISYVRFRQLIEEFKISREELKKINNIF